MILCHMVLAFFLFMFAAISCGTSLRGYQQAHDSGLSNSALFCGSKHQARRRARAQLTACGHTWFVLSMMMTRLGLGERVAWCICSAKPSSMAAACDTASARSTLVSAGVLWRHSAITRTRTNSFHDAAGQTLHAQAGSQQEGAEPAAGQHRTTAGLHTRGRPSCLLGSSSVMCPFLLPRRLLQSAVATQQTCDSSSKQRVVNGARASAGSVSLRKPRRGPAGGRVTVTVA